MMRTLTAAAIWLGLALAACGRGERPADPARTATSGGSAPVHPPDGASRSGTAPAGAGSSETTMSGSSSVTSKPVSVGVSVTETKPGRPPLLRLYVDVSIDNPGDAPRWVAIPKQTPFDGEGGVDRLELRGQGSALLGTFGGNAGVYALRVAPHAKVTISHLEIGWWRASATAAEVPPLAISVADGLTIDGKPAAAWFGVEPLAPDGTRFDATAAPTGAHAAEDEVPLGLTGVVAAPATLALPSP